LVKARELLAQQASKSLLERGVRTGSTQWSKEISAGGGKESDLPPM